MTRALGHSMLSDFGVIWTPSVRLHRLAPGDCCLILASDGVWDVRFLSPPSIPMQSSIGGACTVLRSASYINETQKAHPNQASFASNRAEQAPVLLAL